MNHSDDQNLVTAALSGDQESLNLLLLRHRPYIYNIALKMINHVADAEDVTQEILVKVITNLGSFDRERGKFTTWLYRIVVNHVLNLKTQKYEYLVGDFGDFFTAIEGVEDEPLTPSEEAELSQQIEESKLACMSGMLMCLDRPQRIVFILGALFGIGHTLGGEVLDISAANFRQRLARARKDLYNWMHQRCGLVNTDNPCRCPKRLAASSGPAGWTPRSRSGTAIT
ncbi:RNA polymerase sigma factor [Neolewinella sp.]|uniref:RNA polymerase sigma factor n=1 Tax=Neolewinella sp. TaxID=2993543 RepID=UPI003B516D9C